MENNNKKHVNEVVAELLIRVSVLEKILLDKAILDKEKYKKYLEDSINKMAESLKEQLEKN